MMTKEADVLKEMRKGLLVWYPFVKGSAVLCLGNDAELLSAFLNERGMLSCFHDSPYEVIGLYDYIVVLEEPEKRENPVEYLAECKKHLKEKGHLLLGMNNRLGLRFWCGDWDPYTGINYDGIENYKRAYRTKNETFRGRCFDRAELKEIIERAGFKNSMFYSVLCNLSFPLVLIREDYYPKEDLATRIKPVYDHPDSVFLEEESLYGTMARNGIFHQLANAWMIECFNAGDASDALQVTLSIERGTRYGAATVLHCNDVVEKIAIYEEGKQQIKGIVKNSDNLKDHGIKVVPQKLDEDRITMPYISSDTGQVYLRRLLEEGNVNGFLEGMDDFRDLILRSSEHVREDEGDGEGVILRQAYIDMVPLNSVYMGGEFVLFDQEFSVENYPANAIISRMVCTFYEHNMELVKLYPQDKLLERYGLLEQKHIWRKMDDDFFKEVLRRDELEEYRKDHWPKAETLVSNRQRMNYSVEEYKNVVADIFSHTEGKNLYLFGSGVYTKRFLEMYGSDYDITGILDNDSEKWGTKIRDISIMNPEILKTFVQGEYKVIICIKNYDGVVRQLRNMGVTDYSIYDGSRPWT